MGVYSIQNFWTRSETFECGWWLLFESSTYQITKRKKKGQEHIKWNFKSLAKLEKQNGSICRNIQKHSGRVPWQEEAQCENGRKLSKSGSQFTTGTLGIFQHALLWKQCQQDLKDSHVENLVYKSKTARFTWCSYQNIYVLKELIYLSLTWILHQEH